MIARIMAPQESEPQEGWMGIGPSQRIPLGLVIVGVLLALLSPKLGEGVAAIGFIWLAFTSLPLALALYILASPFHYHISFGKHALYFSDIMALIMFAAFLWKYRKDSVENAAKRLFPEAFRWPLVALLAFSVISLLHAVNHTETLVKIVEYVEFFVIIVGLAADNGLDLNRWKPVLGGLFFGATAIAVWGLIQFWLGIGPHSFVVDHLHTRAYVPFGQPNAFGGFMAMVFVMGLALFTVGPKDRSRPWLLLSLVILALSIFASYSRGAEVAAAAGVGAMVVVGGLTRSWNIAPRLAGFGYGLMAFGLLAIKYAGGISKGAVPKKVVHHYAVVGPIHRVKSIVSLNTFSTHQRILIWKGALHAWDTHKLTGVGLGGFHYWVLQHHIAGVPGAPPHAHDIYLELLADLGIGGFLALVWWQWRWVTVALKAVQGKFGELDPWVWAMALGAGGVITDFGVHNTVDFLIDHGVIVPLLLAFGILGAIVAKSKAAPSDA